MNFPRCIRNLALSVIGVTAFPAHAADFQIFYAEPIQLQAADVAGAATTASPDSPWRVSFQAYGRQFDLALEPNTRLLSGLAPERRRALSRYELLRGKIVGLDRSWVRLTRIGNELSGAIWDGNEFYVVSPARNAARFAIGPLEASETATVVYRLSDTESGLGPKFCGVDQTDDKPAGLAYYRSLVTELQSNQALASVPGDQLEIALIADFELYTRYQQSTEPAMLANMNVVDGIFSEQVGVKLLIAEFTVFTTDTDPFTTNVAVNLIDELATYRENTPAIRDRGIAHLITGRRLSDDTAGIAYLDALCEPFFGVSLTDDSFGNANTPLIAAHEIGHNFGAPHDGVSGSACVGEPQIYLMAPVLNGSNQFSQCSLDQMRPRIAAAAACITRSNLGDAAVSAPASVSGLTDQTIILPIDIQSVGTGTVRDVAVSVTDNAIQFRSASVAGGTCSITGGGVDCQLGSLDAGVSRRIEVGVGTVNTTSSEATVLLTGSNDYDRDNNFARTQIVINPAADAQVSLTPGPINAFTRQPVSITAIVMANGPQQSADVVATIRGSGLTLDSATSDGGSCTQDFSSITCAFGSLAAGTSQRVDLQFSGTRADQFRVTANVSSSNDGDRNNDVAGVGVNLAPARDVTVRTDTPFITVAVNQPFSFSANVMSVGPEAVSNVVASISVPSQITIDALTAEGGTCTIQPVRSCTFGTMPPGLSRRIDVQAHGTQLVGSSGGFSVQASDDDQFGNNSANMQFQVKHGSDVALFPFESGFGREGRTFSIVTPVMSRGVNAANDVTVSVSLPSSFTIQLATLGNGSCTINASTANCTLAALAGGAQASVRVDVSSVQIGSFAATITASASNDADPANNTQSRSLQIDPFFDAGIVVPSQPLVASAGEIFVLPITVNTGPQPVADVSVNVGVFDTGSVQLVSLSTSAGSCSASPQVRCVLGNMNARSSAEIRLSLRVNFKFTGTISVNLNATNDGDFSNNFGSAAVAISSRGDATVGVATGTVTTVPGQPFDLPLIKVSTDRAVDDVFLDVNLPFAVSIGSMSGPAAANCSIIGQAVMCNLGTVLPNTPLSMRLTLIAIEVGTFTSTVSVRSASDTNDQNNSRAITVVVNPSTPPAPPPSSGGGGGGGGALGLLTLAGLLALAARKRLHVDRESSPALH